MAHDERERLLDAVVGQQGEGAAAARVGEAAGDQVAHLPVLHEGQRQNLEFAKVVEADRLQDANAGIGCSRN
jgi:hypothetical protein